MNFSPRIVVKQTAMTTTIVNVITQKLVVTPAATTKIAFLNLKYTGPNRPALAATAVNDANVAIPGISITLDKLLSADDPAFQSLGLTGYYTGPYNAFDLSRGYILWINKINVASNTRIQGPDYLVNVEYYMGSSNTIDGVTYYMYNVTLLSGAGANSNINALSAVDLNGNQITEVLRAWLTVTPALFTSVTPTSQIKFSVWLDDGVTSTTLKLSDGTTTAKYTLYDVVDVTLVQNVSSGSAAAVTPDVNNKYRILYYPNADTKVATTNKIKLATLTFAGGRVATDPDYAVYVYEDDAFTMADGAEAVLSAGSGDTTLVDVYYDVGATALASRNESVYKDIEVTVTDTYRSVTVILTIVPIANPSLTFSANDVDIPAASGKDGLPMLTLTATELTAAYSIGSVDVNDAGTSLYSQSYSWSGGAGVSVSSAGAVSLVAPITTSYTSAVQINSVTVSENGRSISISTNLYSLYVIPVLEINSITRTGFGVDKLETDVAPNWSTTFTFKPNTGYGPVELSYSYTTLNSYYSFSTFTQDTNVTIVHPLTTISSTAAPVTVDLYTLSQALQIPDGDETTYAAVTLTEQIKGPSTTRIAISNSLNVSVYKPLYTIPQAWNASNSALSLTASKLYVERSIANNAIIAPINQLVRGGFISNSDRFRYNYPQSTSYSTTNFQHPGAFYGQDYYRMLDFNNPFPFSVGDMLTSFIQRSGGFPPIFAIFTVFEVDTFIGRINMRSNGTLNVYDSIYSNQTFQVFKKNTEQVSLSGLSLQDNQTVILTVQDAKSASYFKHITFEKYDTFDETTVTLAQPLICAMQSLTGTNTAGVVYNEGTGTTRVFKFGEISANKISVPNAQSVTVTLQQYMAGSWSNFTNADVAVVWVNTTPDANSTTTGYAQLTLSNDYKLDGTKQYRIRIVVASVAMSANELLADGSGVLEPSYATPADITLYQEVIVNETSFKITPDGSTFSDAKVALNFDPYGGSRATVIDYSPRTTADGLQNGIPSYHVHAHGASNTNPLFRLQVSGSDVTAAVNSLDRFMLTVINTTPGAGDDLGESLSVDLSAVTFTTPNASTDTNAPQFFFNANFSARTLYFDNNLNNISFTAGFASVASTSASNAMKNITALAVPNKPTNTTPATYALVFVHALYNASTNTYVTVNKTAYKLAVLSSTVVTAADVIVTPLTSRTYPDSLRLALGANAITFDSNPSADTEYLVYSLRAGLQQEQEITFTDFSDGGAYVSGSDISGTYKPALQALAAAGGATVKFYNAYYGGTTVTTTITLASPGVYAISPAAPAVYERAVLSGEFWYEVASNLPDADPTDNTTGVTSAQLATALFQRSNSYGYPERFIERTTLNNNTVFPYTDTSRWLKYRLWVQNKAAYAPAVPDLGLVASNIVDPAAAGRRTSKSFAMHANVGIVPNWARYSTHDDGSLASGLQVANYAPVSKVYAADGSALMTLSTPIELLTFNA